MRTYPNPNLPTNPNFTTNPNPKAHTKEFTNAFELINEDQWKKNQTVAHARRERETRFDKTATQRKNLLKSNATSTARGTVLTEIDDFERRLESDIYKDDTKLKNSVGRALKRMILEDPGAKLLDTTFLDNTVLRNGAMLLKKKLTERNEDNKVHDSVKDRRRRRFLGDREASHRVSLKEEAASEIINQLLNPSQSEAYEIQYLSRVMLQKELMTENRLNRNQLIENYNEMEARRTEVWKLEETAREIEFVIGHRMAAQLEKLSVLAEATQAAEGQRELERSNAALVRIKGMTEWVLACNKIGLYEMNTQKPEGNKIP
jgi:hypothetical protein